MEQKDRTRPHFERVLFVVGMPKAGKSILLRRMFLDKRLGTNGVIPRAAKIKQSALSSERCLHVRCTSPHEYEDTISSFFDEIDRAMAQAYKDYWRFNFACALQPRRFNHMPGIVEICERFQDRFSPERIRIVQIHPRQDGQRGTMLSRDDIDKLRKRFVQVITIDGRRPSRPQHCTNARILSDFFDFS